MLINSPIDFLTIYDIINNYSNVKFSKGKELSLKSFMYGFEITLSISASKNSYAPMHYIFDNVDDVFKQFSCIFNLNSRIGDLISNSNYIEFNRENGDFKFQIFLTDVDLTLEAILLNSDSIFGKIYKATPNLNERAILCSLVSGMKQIDVAHQFNVSQATISNIYRKFKEKEGE